MTDEDDSPEQPWVEDTTAFDRVKSISTTLQEPQTVPHIAEKAMVSENTTREHLDRLVDLGVLLESTKNGATAYSPDPLHQRMQTLREFLESHDRDQLIEEKAKMQERIEDFQDRYDADSPEELRARAADTDDAEETREIVKNVGGWELIEYRLDIIEDAIENYETYSLDYRNPTE